jgi:hypothetical protein
LRMQDMTKGQNPKRPGELDERDRDNMEEEEFDATNSRHHREQSKQANREHDKKDTYDLNERDKLSGPLSGEEPRSGTEMDQ